MPVSCTARTTFVLSASSYGYKFFIHPTVRVNTTRIPGRGHLLKAPSKFSLVISGDRIASKIESMEVQSSPGNMSSQVIGGTLCVTGFLASGKVFPRTSLPFVDE